MQNVCSYTYLRNVIHIKCANKHTHQNRYGFIRIKKKTFKHVSVSPISKVDKTTTCLFIQSFDTKKCTLSSRCTESSLYLIEPMYVFCIN